jgi:RNA-directed DNA polymerase
VDNQTIEKFEQHLESNLEKLARMLKDGSYRPQAVKRVWIPKPGNSEKRPLLANMYLNALDHAMSAAGYEMVRYADDFVILCRSEEEARQALERVREWTAQAGLILHPEKTRIVKIAGPEEEGPGDGVDFLGYRFERDKIKPREKSLKKFKDTVREATPGKSGRCLPAIIKALNAKLRGWFEYYKHSCQETFPKLDGWIRMRLRSILRKRHKQRGIGKGESHFRWPNAYFVEHGLHSLAQAHAEARRSCRRR